MRIFFNIRFNDSSIPSLFEWGWLSWVFLIPNWTNYFHILKIWFGIHFIQTFILADHEKRNLPFYHPFFGLFFKPFFPFLSLILQFQLEDIILKKKLCNLNIPNQQFKNLNKTENLWSLKILINYFARFFSLRIVILKFSEKTTKFGQRLRQQILSSKARDTINQNNLSGFHF